MWFQLRVSGNTIKFRFFLCYHTKYNSKCLFQNYMWWKLSVSKVSHDIILNKQGLLKMIYTKCSPSVKVSVPSIFKRPNESKSTNILSL